MNQDSEQIKTNTKAIAEMATANAVIARDISYMRAELEKISKKIDQLSKQFASQEQFQNLEERVHNLEVVRDWLGKIIVGAVLAALLALIGLNI